MIQYYQKVGGQLETRKGLEDSVWVNVTPDTTSTSDLEKLAHELKIPLDFLTDSLDIDERSRYEREDDAVLILFNTPFLNDSSNEAEAIYVTLPLGVIMTRNHIVTVSAKENPVLEKFFLGTIKKFNPNDRKLFALQLMEQNVKSFLECLNKLNLRRNLIEQELYNSSRNAELQQLLRIEKSLVYFVTALSTNELLKMKMKRTDLLKIRDLEYHDDLFEDLLIDNSQALEMSNVYTNILGGTMEAYASIVSNNLNVFIQRLTIITIILMVPTLVASFYGMNLEYLPFRDSKYAFPGIITISIVLGFSLMWFFGKIRK